MKAATWGLLCMMLGVRVDEQRAGQRVSAVSRRFRRWERRRRSRGLELALVLVEVSVAEVADGVRAAFDALDQDVIVFGELDVGGGEESFFALAFIGVGIL